MNSILTAVLNGAVVGGVLTAAVWVGLRLAPRRVLNAAARYWVWWAALAAVLVLPLAYLRVPAADETRGASRVSATPAPNAGARGLATPQAQNPAIPLEPVSRTQATAPSSGWSFPLVLRAPAVSRWILTAWAAISVLMLVRLTVSCILLEGRKRRAFAAPRHLTARIEAWLSQRGSTRTHVRLMCSAEIGSPMLAGMRNPAILIPQRLITELEDGDLEQIGLHEAAHLMRRDDYALLVQRTVEALFVFHPVVRWITRQIDLEREIACDDAVVESLGLPRLYAGCLTRMIELCGGVDTSWSGTPAAGARSHLARRVDRLLDRNREPGSRHGKMRLAAAIGVVGALGGLVARVPGVIAFAMPVVEAAAPATPAPVVSLAEDSPAATVNEAMESPAPPAPPQRPANAPSAGTVIVPVTVQDPLNRYVTGLGKENFRLFEDGVQQEISEFSSSSHPISAGIVLDASGSMRDKLDQSRLLATQFLNAASPEDEFFLVTFNALPELAAGFTSDTGQIQNQMNLVQAGGGTALRDAIRRALDEMKNARNANRILLVISEGEDNSSSISQEDLRVAARAANVQIYAITPITPGVSAGRGIRFLRELAEESGGQQFVVDDMALAPITAANVAVRHVYVLGYKSTKPARDGKYRSLRVEVVPPPGLPPLKTNFRAGYYGQQ